jgi:predicted acylesterase/phospholipase RssA
MKRTRYAVVLNGGVSLAIWMGGVTNELNRLRLASEALTNPDLGLDTSNAWAAILEACQRRVAIDVVAGTSAGGLNGTLLATAVARGADMPVMEELWANVASLSVGALTRDVQSISGATSLLDGDYFTRQVEDVVDSIVPQANLARECTLLVTATALDSDPIPTALQSGAMYTRDGRRVYRFDRTEAATEGSDGTDDFVVSAPTVEALKRAARASASFPVAFAPVKETVVLASQRVNPHDDAVGRWLVDGGVLDNAPFEPLLDVLRERPTNEPFERILLYVTPGISADNRVPPSNATPTLRNTLGSVIAAMREPDERLDADALHDLFAQMSQTKSQAFRTIADYLEAPGDAATAPLLQAASDLFEAYRTTRAEATERWLIGQGSGQEQSLRPAPPALLKPNQIPGIPSDDFPAWDGGEWTWGWAAADRILRWWGRALSTIPPDTADAATALTAIGTAQRRVTAQDSALIDAVTGTAAAPLNLPEQLEAMTGVYGGGMAEVLSSVMGPTARAIAAAVPGSDPSVLMNLSLAIEVVSGIFSWAGDDYDAPILRFQRVTPAAETPQGITLGPVGDNADWPSRKLYGERLGHFGAFVSEDGRRHDWLWGRLDGASELSKQLLDAAGISEDDAADLREALTNEILSAENTDVVEVEEGATTVYGLSSGALVQTMAQADGGASFRQLESTVWELSGQFGAMGAWLRAVLAPSWSASDASNVPFTQRVAMQTVRTALALPRRYFRSKLPYS